MLIAGFFVVNPNEGAVLLLAGKYVGTSRDTAEIAGAMLQRQQASAVVAARTQIVEGAVGMVEMALEQLGAKDLVKLDEDRKAAMVSNLLVVLCSEHAAQPIVNTGSSNP